MYKFLDDDKDGDGGGINHPDGDATTGDNDASGDKRKSQKPRSKKKKRSKKLNREEQKRAASAITEDPDHYKDEDEALLNLCRGNDVDDSPGPSKEKSRKKKKHEGEEEQKAQT